LKSTDDLIDLLSDRTQLKTILNAIALWQIKLLITQELQHNIPIKRSTFDGRLHGHCYVSLVSISVRQIAYAVCTSLLEGKKDVDNRLMLRHIREKLNSL
jgi:6-pyruvoyl-tetrahydropterin synthase